MDFRMCTATPWLATFDAMVEALLKATSEGCELIRGAERERMVLVKKVMTTLERVEGEI
jgi:hypothetical protein